MSPKIAIVGASIAGCAAAIALSRAGYDIALFERSKTTLESRGAGIVLPLDLLEKLQANNFLDKDLPNIKVTKRNVIAYDKKENKERVLTNTPVTGTGIHWAGLYNSLLQRVPAKKIQWGAEVSAVTGADKKITLTLNQQETKQFDFVFFADGYNSIGRQFLFPNIQPEYAHYIAWRGTLTRVDVDTTKQILDKVLYYGYKRGHCLIYLIPNVNATNPENDYIINWLVYENVSANHELFSDGKIESNKNITADKMPKKYIEYLQTLVSNFLPDFPRDIVLQTKYPFIQAITDIKSPCFVKNNICLLGDAASILRPHSASGAGKALGDALTLFDIMNTTQDLNAALLQWENIRKPIIDNLFALSRSLGNLLVTHVPDWYNMSQQQMESVWSSAVSDYNWYVERK